MNSKPSETPLLFFTIWVVFSSLLFISPLTDLIRLSLAQDDASYLVMIPFISAAILYMERHKISQNVTIDRLFGGIFLVLSSLIVVASHFLGSAPSLGLKLSGSILALVMLWVSGFSIFFGTASLRAASFPFLFLLLMVPIPYPLLDAIVRLLQEGSAAITGALFDLTGVPALREGLVFHLAKVNIEVAKECSGIRSSMALLILALLVAHFRLRNLWGQIQFVIFGLFMMIVKNGIRIATLTLLAMYVDPSFLFGRLHRQGGIVFFVLALLLMLPVLVFLQKAESKRPPQAAESSA